MAVDRRADASVTISSPEIGYTTIGTDMARGIAHEGLTLSANAYGSDTASWVLKRDPSVLWPDLAAYSPVLVEVAGVTVWSGRLIDAPRQSGSEERIQLRAQGWQYHLDDDATQVGYVHDSLGEWRDLRASIDNSPASTAYGALVQNDRGIVELGYPNGTVWVTSQHVGIQIDLGAAGPRADRVVMQVSAVTPHTFADVYIRTTDTADIHDGTGVDATTLSFNSVAADPSTTVMSGTFSGGGKRVVSVFLWTVGGGGTTASDHILRIHWIRLFEDTAYESANASVLKASDVVSAVRGGGMLPLLSSDESRIAATSFSIPHLWPPDPQTPRQLLEAANAYEANQLQVDVDRRLVFREPPTAPTYVVGEWSGAEFSDASSGSGEDVYSRVVVSGTGPDGNALSVSRSTSDLPNIRVWPEQIAYDGFESGVSSWAEDFGARSQSTTNPYVGSNCMLVQNDGSGYSQIWRNFTVTAANRPHLVRLFVRKVDASGTWNMFVNGYDDLGHLAPSQQLLPNPVTGSYTGYELTFTPRVSGLLKIQLMSFLGTSLGNSYRVDEFSIDRLDTSIPQRRGFERTARVAVSASVNETILETIGDLWLSEHATSAFRGSISATGTGGIRRTVGGAPIHPAHMLLGIGELVCISNIADPDTGAWARCARIVGASYAHEAESVSVQLDNERGRFEALLSRLDVLQGSPT